MIATLTLHDELDAIEAELAPIRCDAHGCPETRRRVLDLIGRAVEIRRKLGRLPYTPAGLSPIVATRIDLVDGRVVVAITHANECDDDTITLGLASDPAVDQVDSRGHDRRQPRRGVRQEPQFAADRHSPADQVEHPPPCLGAAVRVAPDRGQFGLGRVKLVLESRCQSQAGNHSGSSNRKIRLSVSLISLAVASAARAASLA